MKTFKLTSGQCELLMALEAAGSVKELARLLRRDESVVSRQIKQIAAIAPVLEKSEKRWKLSSLGKQMARWSIEAANSQAQLLSQQTSLRIATTREFSAKVLCPNLKSLIQNDDVAISILTTDDGIERDLLSGRADVGIDCGRPEDPLVRYKSVLPEPYVVVAAASFLKKYSVKSSTDLISLPHLKFNRDPASSLLQMGVDIPHIFASFNDLGSVRAACCAGLGWTTLPRYCVAAEIASGVLKQIPGWSLQDRSFGVWWVRGKQMDSAWIDRTIQWLKKQKV